MFLFSRTWRRPVCVHCAQSWWWCTESVRLSLSGCDLRRNLILMLCDTNRSKVFSQKSNFQSDALSRFYPQALTPPVTHFWPFLHLHIISGKFLCGYGGRLATMAAGNSPLIVLQLTDAHLSSRRSGPLCFYVCVFVVLRSQVPGKVSCRRVFCVCECAWAVRWRSG